MANWSTLKAAVAQIIKTNNNQEITGANMQSVLNNIIDNIGENATLAGIATPSTNPGAPDGNVFYFANEPGVYSNFDGLEFESYHLSVLYNKTGTWQRLKVYDCLDSKGSSTKFPMSQSITTFYLESVMPYALLPYTVVDEFIQIDFPAKKVKVASGSYFIVKNKMPYDAIATSLETESVGAYETDFICKAPNIIEAQVWMLAYKV